MWTAIEGGTAIANLRKAEMIEVRRDEAPDRYVVDAIFCGCAVPIKTGSKKECDDYLCALFAKLLK